MGSIGSVLDETKGVGQGFDFLRIFLSFSILFVHSFYAAYGFAFAEDLWSTRLGFIADVLLPGFFALSGFLVMGSALRVRSLTTFMSFRALRILPALSTEVVIAAVLIGGAVTELPGHQYFSSAGFYSYFLNIVGHIQFRLPGVFVSNPYDVVNGSLWTIPPEIFCYLFLALMMLSGAYIHRHLYAAIVVMLAAGIFLLDLGGRNGEFAGHVAQYHLFLCFAFGNLLYHFRHDIPCNFAVFAVCACTGFVFMRYIHGLEVALAAIAYCVVYLGTRRIPRIPFLARGDYSYGVYLYGFPIQQLAAMLFPELRTWYFNVLLAAPVALACAMASWQWIELPTLKMKERFRGLASAEARYLDNPGIVLAIALLITIYGLALMHWSGFEATSGINFRAQWKATTLTAVFLVAIAVAGRRFARRPQPLAASS